MKEIRPRRTHGKSQNGFAVATTTNAGVLRFAQNDRTCIFFRGWGRHCLLCRRPLRSQDRPGLGRVNRDVARVAGAPRCIGAPPACPARAQDSSRGQRPRKVPPSFPDSEGVELPWAAGRKTGVTPPGFDPCRVGRDRGCGFRGRCPRLLYRSPAGIKHGQCRELSGGKKGR